MNEMRKLMEVVENASADKSEDVRAAMMSFRAASMDATGLSFGKGYQDRQKAGRRMRIMFELGEGVDPFSEEASEFWRNVERQDPKKVANYISSEMTNAGYEVLAIKVNTGADLVPAGVPKTISGMSPAQPNITVRIAY